MRVLTGHCVRDERRPAVPAVRRDDRAGASATRAARWRCGRRSATWPRRSPVSRRRCGASSRTSRRPSSCRPSWRAAMCWNSFSEFIGRAAQGQPLLLVLEDLHWADESTVLLTEYLAPLLPEMPVLVLGTYRDVEVDLHHPLARVIGQLGHRRLVERVSLRRLSFDGGARDAAGARRAAGARAVGAGDSTARPRATRSSLRRSICTLSSPACCSTSMAGCVLTLRLDEVSVPESIRLVRGAAAGPPGRVHPRGAGSGRRVGQGVRLRDRRRGGRRRSRTRWSRPSTKRSEPGSSRLARFLAS